MGVFLGKASTMHDIVYLAELGLFESFIMERKKILLVINI